MAQQWSYLTRPAKWIERHILLDALLRLTSVIDFFGHRYVGMGGLEFIDFQMVHRALGVTDLCSIERNSGERDRYEANAPYGCVTIKFGESSEVLPLLPLEERPVIIWLDYQNPLCSVLLAEIVDVAMRLQPQSLLIVTINANPGSAQGRVERVKTALGNDVLRRYVSEPKSGDLTRTKLAPLQSNVIRDAVSAACEPTTSMIRLLDVMYRDDSPMQTLALLVDGDEASLAEAVGAVDWSLSEYVLRGLDPSASTTDLSPPMLTQRERQRLDRRLPGGAIEDEAHHLGLSASVAREYAKMYRWYPQYASVTVGS